MNFRGRIYDCPVTGAGGGDARALRIVVFFIARIGSCFFHFQSPFYRRRAHTLQSPSCPCALSPGTCRREECETFLEAGLGRCRPEGSRKQRSAPTPSSRAPRLTSPSSGKRY